MARTRELEIPIRGIGFLSERLANRKSSKLPTRRSSQLAKRRYIHGQVYEHNLITTDDNEPSIACSWTLPRVAFLGST